MASAASRSWNIMLEKSPEDLEFFIDLGKPGSIRDGIRSQLAGCEVRTRVKKEWEGESREC